MEAFLYQQHQPFLLDPAAYISSSPIEMSFLPLHVPDGEMSNASSSCFTAYNSPDQAMQEDSTGSLDHSVPPPNEPQAATLDKKRRQSNQGSCLSTGQNKGVKENKSRRKKASDALKEKVDEKKPNKDKELRVTKATSEEPPSGYIHVRARRGQATDSHSLAERVRRERISERMKKLQELVPGCDKVIGKALVLDEIINYVQSLQNQVEFLSMKIASVNPILYDFGGGFEDYYMSQAEEMRSISQSIPSVIQTNPIPPTRFETATNTLQQVIDPPAPFSLHGQEPHTFPQDSGSFLMQGVELNNMCSFQ